MTSANAKDYFQSFQNVLDNFLSNNLAAALRELDMYTSGTKDERVERLLRLAEGQNIRHGKKLTDRQPRYESVLQFEESQDRFLPILMAFPEKFFHEFAGGTKVKKAQDMLAHYEVRYVRYVRPILDGDSINHRRPSKSNIENSIEETKAIVRERAINRLMAQGNDREAASQLVQLLLPPKENLSTRAALTIMFAAIASVIVLIIWLTSG